MSDKTSPVPELELLREVHDRIGGPAIAPGFGLTEFGSTHGNETWSPDPAFLDAIPTFAYANGSGSTYSLWRVDGRADLATLPVVVFGDEGGVGVVARDLPTLFRQLACERPLYVGDYRAWFDDEPPGAEEALDRHGEYVTWLERHFGLTPAEDPNALVEEAEKEWAAPFARWMGRFLDDEVFVEEYLDDLGLPLDGDGDGDGDEDRDETL